MQANLFTFETAREHEAYLLNLAKPAKILPPRPERPTKSLWLLRIWRRRAIRAALGGSA